MALNGTETLQVQGKDAQGRPSGQTFQTTTQEIANLAGVTGVPQIVLDGSVSGSTTIVPQATASGTLSLPAATDTLVGRATTDTLTNKTLTSPVLGGTVTGTYTLGGTPTIGISSIQTNTVRTSAAVTKNASAAYSNVTGLSVTVVPGTYAFVCRLPSTVANGTGGIKYGFNYTTTVLTSIESTGRGFTASAVAVQHTTTTTTQTDLFTQAAVVIYTEITGSMVVATGGTIDLQMAQNTSNGSDTVALIGGTMEFTRIA